jgi:hypothetical protein
MHGTLRAVIARKWCISNQISAHGSRMPFFCISDDLHGGHFDGCKGHLFDLVRKKTISPRDPGTRHKSFQFRQTVGPHVGPPERGRACAWHGTLNSIVSLPLTALSRLGPLNCTFCTEPPAVARLVCGLLTDCALRQTPHAANPSNHGIRPSQSDHRLRFKTSETRLTANTPVVGTCREVTTNSLGACMLLGSPAVGSLPAAPFARTGHVCPRS